MSSTDATTVTIASPLLRADLRRLGAELVRLQDGEGRELLWNGDPTYWHGFAPLLFPIVGTVAGDTIRVDGKAYPLPRHGFARRSRFALVDHTPSRCHWRLAASAETRAVYPFEFTLDVVYAIAGATLSMEARVTNAGTVPLPAAFGFHPAFRWPLPYGARREDHRIRFEKPEPAPIRRLADGLLAPQSFPSPVQGDTLALADGLFRDDAVIFDRLASRRLVYGGPTGATLEVAFPGMPQLGLWSKPDAGYLCIEPWYGYASPAGFDGELADKPGMAIVPPGAAHDFGMAVTLGAPADA